MTTTIGFRPTQDDQRILREAARPGETTSDTLRRALRLLAHDQWLHQFRSIDVRHLVGEPVDHLSHEQIMDVEHALAHYLGVVGLAGGPPF